MRQVVSESIPDVLFQLMTLLEIGLSEDFEADGGALSVPASSKAGFQSALLAGGVLCSPGASQLGW